MAEREPRGAADGQRALIRALLLLTLGTGFIDAASFLGLGRVFTANMTGNVVILGFGLADVSGFTILAPLISLGAFLVGAVAGGRLVATREEARWPLLALFIEFAVLVTAAVIAGAALDQGDNVRYVVVALVAGAMGVRNAAVRQLGVKDLTTTIVTMTITGLAADSSLAGGSNPNAPRRVGAVLALLAGALLGALLVQEDVALALAAAALIVLPTMVLFHEAIPRDPDEGR